jgi:hypothetical protein
MFFFKLENFIENFFELGGAKVGHPFVNNVTICQFPSSTIMIIKSS